MDGVPSNVQKCLTAVEQIRFAAVHAHETGVGRLCGALCTIMGLESRFAACLHYAAGLHDIGKMTLPDAILKKPGELDANEWAIMRQHPKLGYSVLQGSADATVKIAARVALCHHECWDGSGYPDGLAGEAIPREARIVALCDVYHALREVRPYKPALSHDQVRHIILEGDGSGRTRPTKFDPAVLTAFALHSDLIRQVFEQSLARDDTSAAD